MKLIDFGTARKFMNSDGKHVGENQRVKTFLGNGVLNSYRVVKGLYPTRADDMISIGLLMLFMIDKLPY